MIVSCLRVTSPAAVPVLRRSTTGPLAFMANKAHFSILPRLVHIFGVIFARAEERMKLYFAIAQGGTAVCASPADGLRL